MKIKRGHLFKRAKLYFQHLFYMFRSLAPWKQILIVVVAVFGLTIGYWLTHQPNYSPGYARNLLPEVPDQVSKKIKHNFLTGSYTLEYGSDKENIAQTTSAPVKISANRNPKAGVTLEDGTNQVSMKITPRFSAANGKLTDGHIVYPLKDESWLVYTLQANGMKEDILVAEEGASSRTYEYDLHLNDGMEARAEKDGSVGVYGDTLLSGDVQTGSAKDAELLQKAREKANKTTLLFRIPRPIIHDITGKTSRVNAKYELEGSLLRLVVTDMEKGKYPLTIDPTVYISTAEQFMAGNNETNIDFDVANSLIKKGSTTGARFDSWNATQGLNTSLWKHGTAVAGGYIYTAGGIHPNGVVVPFTSAGTSDWVVPAGITSVTVKAWGAGGGGGGGSTNGDGGDGGGGGFIQSTLSVSAGQTLSVTVGSGGTGGTFSSGGSGSNSGDGGGGGGYSRIVRSGSTLLVAAGGAGGGGGDNSSSSPGGQGGAGGGSTGQTGGSSGNAGGGGGGTSGSGGAGGTGGNNSGSSGSSLQGGDGADGRSNNGTDGSASNGASPGGGDGGIGDSNGNGYGAGGGGGGGYYGGGGGSGSQAGDAGGGGGGGGSSYSSGSGTVNTVGTDSTPGNDSDSDRGTAGEGGTGGSGTGGGSTGSSGTIGAVYISYATSTSATKTVEWAQFDTSDGTITSANPGSGTCSGWCSSSDYELPAARSSFSLVAYNGFLYAIGGADSSCTTGNQTGDGGVCSTVYIAKLGANGEPQLWHPTDTNQDHWVYWFHDTDLPTPRSNIKAVAYNNRMYLMGGITSSGGSPSVVDDVDVADISANGTLKSWTSETALPYDDYGYTTQVYNDRIYLIGGASTVGGTPRSEVYYNKINSDGTLNAWHETTSLPAGRMSDGGDIGSAWGAYLYVSGGCDAVNGSGYCTSIADTTYLASINADGTLDNWNTVGGVSDTRTGHTLIGWRGYLYNVGGCSAQNTSTGLCTSALTDINLAEINPDGEASTVATSVGSGTAPCSGANPYGCDLPGPGSSTPVVGNVLSGSAILNGYLYIWGGCDNTNTGCGSVSRGVIYTSVGSDGSLTKPASCGAWSSVDAYCYNSTSLPTGGAGAPGVAVAGGRIYSIGGFTSGGMVGNIYYAAPDPTNGSISSWSTTSLTGIGATSVSYPYAFARANPAQASSVPNNLYILGGCTNATGIGCPSNSSGYTDRVYKCNLNTSGVPSGCTTSGQLQIGTVPGANSAGLGAMAGTVYANYIYLMGGLTNGLTDLKTTRYARIDDSNNIVAVPGSSGWRESSELTYYGRRRGSGFGYNGYLYVVGGYDGTGGGGVLADIEFAKINVSDGSIEPWTVSSVSIDERWGLAMTVSNSYAYVSGGCIDGNAPTCNSGGQTNSIQTFQVYNNGSGAPAGYSTSANAYADETNRLGASAAVLNGKLYIAGGCNSTSGSACSSVSDSVEYTTIDSDGDLGTWTVSAGLPEGRAWGSLKPVGNSLYYIGGQNASGTAQSDVYYNTSPTSAGSSSPVFRSTTYKLAAGQFTGTTYTLNLNNNLSTNYFAMVTGGDNTGNTSGPDSSQIRVSADPFSGNFGSTTGSGNQIELTRGGSTSDWVGSITVVECLTDCSTDGFTLSEVKEVSLTSGSANTLQTSSTTLSSSYDSRTVPFGGYFGGGLSTSTSGGNDFSPTAGVRIQKSGGNQLTLERYGGNGRTPGSADVSIYVVQWGTNWNVQEANFNNWDAGGGGADVTGEYATQSISSVNRDTSWVWKSPGTSDYNGLGSGSFGKILTLGDGVNTNTSETSVAIGSNHNGYSRRDTVYVMSHSSLANDYRFLTQSNHGTSFNQTVDAAVGSESYASAGGITSSEGFRIPLLYNSDSGNGTAYTRTGGWSHHYTASTTIQANKSYSGNTQPGWWESVDFGNITSSSGGGWQTASNGLPAARTQLSAAVWNNRLYVVGGLNSSGNPTNTVYVSPVLTGGGNITSSWSTSTAFNVARSGMAAVAYANNLYIFGGQTASDYLSDVQYTKISTSDGSVGSWTYSTSMPKTLVNAQAFARNGYIYVSGGRTAATTCSPVTLVAPVSANTTIASGNNPTGVGAWYETNKRYSGARYGASAAYYEGKKYILGGSDCSAPTSYTTPLVQQSTLLSQPQVAKYSRRIDTDTNVFPTNWLLNGVDNSIGAFWQTKYQSATDSYYTTHHATFDQGTDGDVVDESTTSAYNNCYGSGSGTNKYSNNQYITPGLAMRINIPANLTGAGGCVDDIDTTETRYDRFYVRFDSYANLDSNTVIYNASNTGAGGETVAGLQIRTDGTLRLRDKSTATGAAINLPANTWHRIEVAIFGDRMYVNVYKGSNVNGDVPDDSVDIDLTNASVNDFDRIAVGVLTNVSPVSPNSWGMYVDDHKASNAFWPGSAYPQWGETTNFGDTTLGTLNTFEPKASDGENTSYARWYNMQVSIDASQTYGYPDDVSRGPTINDLSLYFTADPSKRLMHGRTFTGGEQQPLDTPKYDY